MAYPRSSISPGKSSSPLEDRRLRAERDGLAALLQKHESAICIKFAGPRMPALRAKKGLDMPSWHLPKSPSHLSQKQAYTCLCNMKTEF
ncbi:putative aryl-alcohol dehydrogenase AAD14 [Fusarium oxysporum f. sp. albedinis]|nr:putative aryl-alcohol dehydrogenase AAD14 [Fusarium oxysporum f. sp. albedinis]